MRCTPIVAALSAAALATGCQPDCGDPTQYNGYSYRVFANPVLNIDSTNPRFTAAPDYWSYGTPANGLGEWNIQWGGVPDGPATVVIDGQAFEGAGSMDTLECGLGTLDFTGQYTDPRSLVVHDFNASMAFSHWVDNGVGRLGAYLIWKEAWSHPSGETGNFTADSHLSGDLVSQVQNPTGTTP